jgi:crotonobetainyl-CoA:carnitine CoA-transferase CaiB-like acyl-CoA transferase
MRPLEGITVVSLEHAIAAPFCTRHLADLGARVIKVERPESGDFAREYDQRVRGMSSHFVWANRSKESITLDLKNDEEIALLRRLLGQADVFVQNLAPGSTDRMGLSFEELRSTHPRLIVCDISGYGSDGPYRDRKAYDLLIQSEAGFLSVTGDSDAQAKAGISIADISAAMYAYSNILAALINRAKTGHGCRIEISMLECMVEWMGYPLYYTFEGLPPPPRAGASHASIYPYGPFEVGDGRSVMLGIQNDREWREFCRTVIDQPELADDPSFAMNSARSAQRAALGEIIRQAFSRLTQEEVIDRLDRAAIANADVNTLADVWGHPQLAARKRWVEVDSPAGKIPALLPPGVPAEFAAKMGAVPALGEHNASIRAELAGSDPGQASSVA